MDNWTLRGLKDSYYFGDVAAPRFGGHEEERGRLATSRLHEAISKQSRLAETFTTRTCSWWCSTSRGQHQLSRCRQRPAQLPASNRVTQSRTTGLETQKPWSNSTAHTLLNSNSNHSMWLRIRTHHTQNPWPDPNRPSSQQ